jgi:hypothetical protein
MRVSNDHSDFDAFSPLTPYARQRPAVGFVASVRVRLHRSHGLRRGALAFLAGVLAFVSVVWRDGVLLGLAPLPHDLDLERTDIAFGRLSREPVALNDGDSDWIRGLLDESRTRWEHRAVDPMSWGFASL